MPGLAVDPHVPTRLLDDAVNRGETEACAFPGLLGGEKGIEGVLPGVTTHSDAVVADGKHHIATRNHGRVLAGVGLVQLDVPCLDADRSAAWHSVACVDDEVHQDLLDLPGVGDDVSARRTARGDRDVFANEPLQHRFYGRYYAVQIENARLQNLFAAERQQLSRER